MIRRQLDHARVVAACVSIAVSLAVSLVGGCVDHHRDDSDDLQRKQEERLLAEGTAQTGMPAIRNFRERKLMKDVLELRDQANLVTFTYLVAAQSAELRFLCDSIGYGIPAATQYTSPAKVSSDWNQHGYAMVTVPQADPNGLFSPSAAEGTWVMCKDPNQERGDVRPVYIEERIIVSPFRLEQNRGSAERTVRILDEPRDEKSKVRVQGTSEPEGPKRTR